MVIGQEHYPKKINKSDTIKVLSDSPNLTLINIGPERRFSMSNWKQVNPQSDVKSENNWKKLRDISELEGTFKETAIVARKDGSGDFPVHIFETAEGEVGVFGGIKVLDQELEKVDAGSEVRIENDGLKPSKSGRNYYDVKVFIKE